MASGKTPFFHGEKQVTKKRLQETKPETEKKKKILRKWMKRPFFQREMNAAAKKKMTKKVWCV